MFPWPGWLGWLLLAVATGAGWVLAVRVGSSVAWWPEVAVQKSSCGARCIGNKIFPTWQKSQLECDGFCLLILGDYGYRGSELCFPMTGDWTPDLDIVSYTPSLWGASSVTVPAWQLKTTSLSMYCGFSVILILQHPLSTSPTSHTSRYNQNFARLSWPAAGRSFRSLGPPPTDPHICTSHLPRTPRW